MHTNMLHRGQWAARWPLPLLAMLLALLACLPAQAQRHEEGDGWRILQARYGTAERHVDVTDRLRELAREDRGFKLTNKTFGIDPDPGRVKTLRIHARGSDGRTRTFEYREGSQVDGGRFAGWSGGGWGQGGWNGGWSGGGSGGQQAEGEYEILQARYGTARRNIDVTDRLRELARQDRSFKMGNKTFGTDPDPGQVKTLRIHARSERGGTRTFEYREGSVVDGAMFSGWSGGGWGNGGWNGGWGGGSGGGHQAGELQILSASYGAGSRQADVTQRLQSMVNGRFLELPVSNDVFGYDPAPETPKMLRVTYRDTEGRVRTVTASERQILRIR
ncbi:MAG: hypothetical protein ACK4PH_08745 [Aquincola tertiaricarbonis]